ncbi:MAG: TerC family protein [Planctomycetota bacterium]
MDWITNPEAWIALLTLTSLEIVLGIDNIVFISILAGKLPAEERDKARKIGLALAMFMRIALLLSITWIMGLNDSLFELLGRGFSGRDLILIAGGLFLIAKSTHEIHGRVEGGEAEAKAGKAASLGRVLVQIMLLDMVFSLDSVITAVGMANDVGVMVTAVVLSVGFMMWWAKPIGEFVEKHPTVKILALSFLLLIGTALIADGLEFHIPKGYIYFAMGFSLLVEMLNLRVSKIAGESAAV